MKKLLSALTALAVCSFAAADDGIEIPDSTGFKFTDVTLVKDTPVKDQNRSGTCWCFAGISFIEDELLRKTGKEYDLSEMYVVRHCYLDKADRYVRNYGQTNFAQGGGLHDVPYVWAAYGIVPEQAYSGLEYGEKKHDHSELEAGMAAYLRAIKDKPSKRLSTAWNKALTGIIDAYLGPEPSTFTYEGKTYTPATFAASLPLDMDEYVAVTSFSHHPFYQEFALEVPDNWMSSKYYNVPLDEMQKMVDDALDAGYPVMWAADVSEGGFKWRKGYAVIPKEIDESSLEGTELSRWVQLSDKDRQDKRYDISGPVEEMEITQEVRQAMYDRQETTDDHGMVIVGRAVDQNGNPYYKVKNSWDTNQLYGGYLYCSVPYFRAKTMGIFLNKNAIKDKHANKK